MVRIEAFGAFVNIGGDDGLVHISEIASFRIENINDYLKLGDVVPVVVKEIDERKRINLSIKASKSGFHQTKNPAGSNKTSRSNRKTAIIVYYGRGY